VSGRVVGRSYLVEGALDLALKLRAELVDKNVLEEAVELLGLAHREAENAAADEVEARRAKQVHNVARQ